MPVVPCWPEFFGHLNLQIASLHKTDIFSALHNIKLRNKNCLKEKKFYIQRRSVEYYV
jgi:hypothetical protein